MAYTKVKQAVIDGVMKHSHDFNTSTFPQKGEDWSPEQQRIWEFLNGESSGLNEIHVSHRDGIRKDLSRIAGIEMSSRFDITKTCTPPPYTGVVFRSNYGPYPSGYPLIASKISGMWSETGGGSSDEIVVKVKELRPITDDEVNSFFKTFPNDKLPKLYGAIQFPDPDKLRKTLAGRVNTITREFEKTLEEIFPEGLTEKGKQIIHLRGDISSKVFEALSIVLEDPAMLMDYHAKPESVEFPPYVAIVPTINRNSHNYPLDKVCVRSDIRGSSAIFFHPELIYGNQMDANTSTFRIPSPEEIDTHFKDLDAGRLHLYISMLNEDQVEPLL